MKLKKIPLLVTLLLGGSLFAAAEYNSVVVNLNNGDKTVVIFEPSLHAGFSETDMLFKSETIDIAIPRADIKDFKFDEVSGITRTTSEIGVSFSADAIRFANLPLNSSVQVFSAAGVLLLTDAVSGEYQIPTSRLPKGVSLVKVNNLTYKVNIK